MPLQVPTVPKAPAQAFHAKAEAAEPVLSRLVHRPFMPRQSLSRLVQRPFMPRQSLSRLVQRPFMPRQSLSGLVHRLVHIQWHRGELGRTRETLGCGSSRRVGDMVLKCVRLERFWFGYRLVSDEFVGMSSRGGATWYIYASDA